MALDTFETLLSLGTGFASGSSKRRRDNELIELDIKQKEQTARINRISSIEKSLLTLFNTEQFSAESMMAALQSVPQLVDDERSSFSLLEKKPELPEQPKPLTEFQRQSLDLRKQTLDATKADRKLKANNAFKDDIRDAIFKGLITPEQGSDRVFNKTGERIRYQTPPSKKKISSKDKVIKEKLQQFDKQIKNHRARISQILKELKDFDFKERPDRKKSLNFEVKNRENKIKSLETQSENLIRRIGSTGRDKFIQSPFGGTLRTQENSKAQLQRLEAQVKQDIQSGIISAEDGFFKIVELRKQLGTQ